MKRTFTLLSFLIFLVSVTFANTIQIELFQNPTPPGPKPLSLNYYSLSATNDETGITVYFDWSVGNASITVYDEAYNIVHQEVVNTSSTTEVYINNTAWSSDDYTLKVSYGTTNLIGYFNIP